jgi:hypothetical protein
MIHAKHLTPAIVGVSGLRRAVRELLVCGAVASFLYFCSIPPDSANAREPLPPSLIVGVLAAIPLWIAYRIIRFAIGR